MIKFFFIIIITGVCNAALSKSAPPLQDSLKAPGKSTAENLNGNLIKEKEVKDFSGYKEFSSFIESNEYKEFVKKQKNNEFKINSYYMLIGNTNKLKDADKTSNCTGDGCTLIMDSKFRVIDVTDEETKIIIIELGVDDKPLKDKKTSEKNNSSKAKNEATKAKKGYVYTHETKELFIRSKKLADINDYFDHLSLRAVLVPQKFYSSTNAFSSNPTVGVGLSFSSYRRSELTNFLSITMGAGFNQITIDTSSGANEKTGFSYFIGYDFTDNSGLSAGIYLGWDVVDLKDGETFNGLKNETQKWIGLVLSTGF